MGLAKHLLGLVCRATAADDAAAWCGLLLDLVGAAPTPLLPDLLWMGEAAMRHSGALCAAMQRRLAAETADARRVRPLPSSSWSQPAVLNRMSVFLLLLLRSPRPPAGAVQTGVGPTGPAGPFFALPTLHARIAASAE